jgi:hypothetical protein
LTDPSVDFFVSFTILFFSPRQNERQPNEWLEDLKIREKVISPKAFKFPDTLWYAPGVNNPDYFPEIPKKLYTRQRR